MLTFAAVCRGRVHMGGSKVIRLMSSHHYDSQSGVRYEISDQINIYLLKSNAKVPPISPPVHLLEAIKLQETNTEIYNVRSNCPDSVAATLSRLQVSQFPNKRCIIQDAFSSSSSLVQTISAKLCDAGCTHLILAEETRSSDPSTSTSSSDSITCTGTNSDDDDSPTPMASIDADDVREVVEAVLWNDVVGSPMSERVGLRALGSSVGVTTCSTEWRDQVEEALELNVKHFDASFDGVRAPSWKSLVSLFDSQGLNCNLTSK